MELLFLVVSSVAVSFGWYGTATFFGLLFIGWMLGGE